MSCLLCIETKIKKTKVSLKKMSDKFQIFSDWYFRIKFCFKCKIFFQLTLDILKFQYVFQSALKLHWLAETQRHWSCLYDVSSSYSRLVTLQWRRVSTGSEVFLKRRCSWFWKTKCEITYSFIKTLEHTYERVQFSEGARLQPATLLKINFFIYKSKDFRGVFTKICRILSIYLLGVGSCSYSNHWITQRIESI